MCFWKIPEGQGWSPDHPGSRSCLFHFWSQLSLKQHQLHASLIQAYYISKFYKKVNRKCAGNQEEQ